MHETDDDVGDLHAGVVDVVLHPDLVAGFVAVGAEQALKGVAQNGVAQMADVRGLVGVDAGVLDQAKAGTADIGVAIGSDARGRRRRDRGGCSGSRRRQSRPRRRPRSAAEIGVELGRKFGGDGARSFAQTLGELKGDGQGEFAERDVGRLLDGELCESDVVLRAAGWPGCAPEVSVEWFDTCLTRVY